MLACISDSVVAERWGSDAWHFLFSFFVHLINELLNVCGFVSLEYEVECEKHHTHKGEDGADNYVKDADCGTASKAK